MATIIVDPDNIIEGDDVTTNTTTREVTINPGTGTNIPAAADGIALQALYSWYKEEWKDVANRSRYPFLFDAVTPEQMEMRKGWQHSTTTSEKAVRTGGWRYIDTDNGNKIVKEFFGAVSLGNFEDATTDTAYYVLGDDPTDTGAAVDFDFAGPVNEPVLVYENLGNPDTCTFTTSTITRATGSFVTDGYTVGGQVTILGSTSNDGTYTITGVSALTLTVTGTPFAAGADGNAELAVNNRNAIALFLRERDGDPNGKTFSKSALTDIGVSEVDNKVFRFPLSNATDLKISATDGAIAGSPWSEVRLRYLANTYNREVDSATPRNFGIIVDVGTYSRANGAAGTTSRYDSADLNLGIGEALADYAGGSLTIHEGTNAGTYTISGTPVNNAGTLEISLVGTPLTVSGSAESFTMDRATPITATAEQIFEKVQFQLRQAADIDESGTGVVTGRTADAVLGFVGDTLEAGRAIPTNPNGGGSGVLIEGFDSNDTNRLVFYDNTGTNRTFPFVAAGNILVNLNAVADNGPAEYVMYFEYTEALTSSDISVSGIASNTADFSSPSVDFVAELTLGDFVNIPVAESFENVGIWEVTSAPTGTGPWTVELTRVFPTNIAPEIQAGVGTTTIQKNPIDTDDAIVVNDNSGTPITGTVGVQTIPFDFDYDNNVQGGRTAGSDAPVIVRVLGTDVAVNAEGSGTITQGVGISIAVSNPLERNYLNP